MKGGFGFASYTVRDGPTVGAAVTVNAFGDVHDPDSGRILAGCRRRADSRELVGAPQVLVGPPPELDHPWETNTTLAVVLTDAALSKNQLRKVCDMAFGGLYRTVRPALSLYDGDLVVALATGRRRARASGGGTGRGSGCPGHRSRRPRGRRLRPSARLPRPATARVAGAGSAGGQDEGEAEGEAPLQLDHPMIGRQGRDLLHGPRLIR